MSDHTAFTNSPIVQYYHPPDSLHFQGAPATWNGFNNRTPSEVIEHARGDLGYLRRNGQTSDRIVSSEDCINLGTNTEGNQQFADFVLLNAHVSAPGIQDTPDAYGHAQVRLYDARSRPPQDWTVPCLSAGPVTFQRNPQVRVPPLDARTRFSFQLPQHAPVYPACTHNNLRSVSDLSSSPSLPTLFSADAFTTTTATSARSEALVYPDDDLALPALEPTEEEQEVDEEVDELESDEETRMDVEEDRQTPGTSPLDSAPSSFNVTAAPALVHACVAHPHPLAMCGAGPYSPTTAHVDVNDDASTLDLLYGPVPPFVPRAHSAPSPHPSIASSRPNSAAERQRLYDQLTYDIFGNGSAPPSSSNATPQRLLAREFENTSDKAADVVDTDNDDSIVTSVDPAFPDALYTLAQVARPFATQNWTEEVNSTIDLHVNPPPYYSPPPSPPHSSITPVSEDEVQQHASYIAILNAATNQFEDHHHQRDIIGTGIFIRNTYNTLLDEADVGSPVNHFHLYTDNHDHIDASGVGELRQELERSARPWPQRIEALTAARERVLTVINICEEFLTPRMMNEVLGHTSFLRCDERCVADYQLDREQYFHHRRPVFLPLVTPGEVRHLRTIAGVLSYHGLRSLSNDIEDLLQTSLPDEDIVYCLTQLGSLDNDGPLHLDAREVINTVQWYFVGRFNHFRTAPHF
ncbi:hypothetical protein BV22DRAFT_1135693, partial [Leucogyrophana mollusca]